MSEQVKKKFEFPNTWIIVVAMVAITAVLTWLVPSGCYDYQQVEINGNMRSIAINGTFHFISKTTEGVKTTDFLGIFSALYKGCVDAANIVFLIIFCSGAFGVMVETGVFHAGIGSVLKKIGNKSLLIVPILMLLFGISASTLGLVEEFYGFYPLMVGVGTALGYDAMFGFAILALGEYIGFMGAIFNPYTVAIAQSIAGLPLYSATPFRVVCFVVFMAVSVAYLMCYGQKYKKDPTISPVYGLESPHVFTSNSLDEYKFDTRAALVLLDMVLTFTVLMIGIIMWKWNYPEICGLFLIMSMIAAAIMGWSPNKYCDVFTVSAKSVLWGVLLTGIAKGIVVVMKDAQIIDTVIYALANLLKGAPIWISAQLMLLVHTLINLPVTSGSGQAAVTMPIMAPLADHLGISRQIACIAFQFGDGLSNLIWPTGGCVIICGISGIPYEKWLKWFMPLFGILYVLEMVMLQIAVVIGLE